jgi:hypothetical protein
MFAAAKSQEAPKPTKPPSFLYEYKGKQCQLWGINPGDVLGFYQTMSEKNTCYAACLSNAIMTAGRFVDQESIIEKFDMKGWKTGPKPSDYGEMINLAMQDLAGMTNCKCTVVDDLGRTGSGSVQGALETTVAGSAGHRRSP